jgi:putative radical SAM enzyme (TIGR03279 family)
LLDIAAVLPGSTAERAGIRAGDRLVSLNGHVLRDSIDYQFYSAEERLSVVIQRPGGARRTLKIVKRPDDTLGLSFPPFPVRRCRNNCIFCFVDQMPRGCRKSLYVKDDDYRASFLFGNYITLSNLREEDWDRIFEQRLSPLYLSVHATEPDVRAFLIRNKKAPDILSLIRRLAEGGIRMHAQIVLCPGINDGAHLERTVADLASFYPSVQSIAAVPVGMTAFREGLFPVRSYRPAEARTVVLTLEAMGKRYRSRLGTRLVFASDEFYIKANMPLPPARFYEDFPQLENGVGMVAEFLRDARRIRMPRRVPPRLVTVVTGVSFSPLVKRILERVKGIGGVSLRVITAKNRFFGETVTVAGLLTGSDVLAAVTGRRLGSLLIIPATMLRDDERTFLDDMTIGEVQAAAGVPVRAVSRVGDLVRLLQTPLSRGFE